MECYRVVSEELAAAEYQGKRICSATSFSECAAKKYLPIIDRILCDAILGLNISMSEINFTKGRDLLRAL